MLMDCTTRELSFFNENNGLQNNTVLSVSFDPAGNLWAGLDNGMAYVCLASPFTNLYSHPHYGTGYAAAVQGDYLYLGTNKGLLIYDIQKQQIKPVKMTSPIDGSSITCSVSTP